MWGWFQELSNTRQFGAMGPNPITHQEITFWAEGNGIDLIPTEREAICAIDRTFILHAYSKDKPK